MHFSGMLEAVHEMNLAYDFAPFGFRLIGDRDYIWDLVNKPPGSIKC
jgi:hypothetical protein